MSYIHTSPAYQASPYGMASLAPIAWTGQRRTRPCLVRVHRRHSPFRAVVRRTFGATESSTGTQQGEQAAATAAMFIPVVGPAISAAIKIVGGDLAQHHAAAVAKEAVTVNGAAPQFIETVQGIMAALNAGQLTPASAISALQSAQTTYYSAVSGIIKKGGACKTPYIPVAGTPGPPNQCPVTLPNYWRDCAASGSCNASCAIGCGMVEPTVSFLIQIIRAGGGTFTIPATPVNGSIQGTPAVIVSYDGSQGTGGVGAGLQSVLGGTILGVPTWMALVGGGLLLLVLMK